MMSTCEPPYAAAERKKVEISYARKGKTKTLTIDQEATLSRTTIKNCLLLLCYHVSVTHCGRSLVCTLPHLKPSNLTSNYHHHPI